jgi:hypothetical protein
MKVVKGVPNLQVEIGSEGKMFSVVSSLIILFLFFIFYSWGKSSKITIQCKKTQENERICSALLRESFKLPFWGSNGHLQSLYCMYLRRSPHVIYSRFSLSLPSEPPKELPFVRKMEEL